MVGSSSDQKLLISGEGRTRTRWEVATQELIDAGLVLADRSGPAQPAEYPTE